MGTVLKQKNNSIRGRVQRYGLMLLFAVLIGFGLLAYQSYRFYSGQSSKRPNFDIGALWNSDESPALESIDATDLVFEVIPERVLLQDVVNPPRLFIPEDPRHHVVAKEAILVNPERVARAQLDIETFGAERKEVDFLEIPVFSADALSMRYIERLENDFLIAPDLTPTKAKWFVEFSFAPSLSYRTLKYRDQGMSGVAVSGNTRYTYGMTEQYRNETDRAISSFYSGLDIGYNIGDRLSISTGLYYAVYGENISVSSIDVNDFNVQDAEFYQQTPLYYSPENEKSSNTINYDNRYSYFEIPITLRYRVYETEKSDIALQAGAYFQRIDHVNALVYDFDTDYYYWLPKNDLEIYNTVGFGAMAGVSIAQNISNTVEVFVNPQVKFNTTSSFDDCYGMEQKHYTTGLRLGVRKQLTSRLF